MAEEQSTKQNSIDKFIDSFFADSNKKWILGIVLLGLILRFVVASHLRPAPDEMVHGTHAMGLIASHSLGSMSQSPLWFYLTDLSYKIFGISLFSARILSIIFGTLSIILVFLIGKTLFSSRAGLIGAFLLAISPYHIIWTSIYMDESMMFFILFAAYYFVKEYPVTKKIPYTLGLLFGLAFLMKIVAGPFVVGFGLCFVAILYKNYKSDRKLFSENLKRTLGVIGIVILMFTPILVYNYFIYREKGILDFPFAQYFNVNRDFYKGSGLAHDNGFTPSAALPNVYTVVKHYFLGQDLVVFLSGVLGFILLYRTKSERKFSTHFLLFLTLFALVFIAISIVLQTHFTSFTPLFAIAGGFFWSKVISKGEKSKKLLIGIMTIFLILTLFFLRNPLTSTSAVQNLREFTSSTIPQDALVVVDARIYSGISAWALADRHYINAGYFPQILSQAQTAPSNVEMDVYFVECAIDDCGWGSVASQPDLNLSMEQMTYAFMNASLNSWNLAGGGVIKGVKEGEIKGETHFRVYQTRVPLPRETLNAVDQTHEFFFYRIPRNQFADKQFDYYELLTPFDQLLSFIGKTMLYLSILLALVFIGVLMRTTFSSSEHK